MRSRPQTSARVRRLPPRSCSPCPYSLFLFVVGGFYVLFCCLLVFGVRGSVCLFPGVWAFLVVSVCLFNLFLLSDLWSLHGCRVWAIELC